MKSLLLILAASLLVAAFFRAVMRLLRANREEQRDTEPSPMFSTTIRDGRDMPPIELGKHVIPITSVEQWGELTGGSCSGFEQAIRSASELPPRKLEAIVFTAEPTPPPKLNPDLPPMDFGELPDVTEDAVESAARSLSERPKGEES